jgi:hypothetical protein
MTKNEEKNKKNVDNKQQITSSNMGVEKAHWKHQVRYVGHENFLFPTIK